MHIESYLNGELVSVESASDYIPSPVNVTGFIIRMISNGAYNQLVQTNSNQLAANRLETAVVRLELKSDITFEDLSLFKFLWANVIDGATISVANSDLAEWNQIAESSNMPFSFDDDFKIELK